MTRGLSKLPQAAMKPVSRLLRRLPVSSMLVGPPKGWHGALSDYRGDRGGGFSWEKALTTREEVVVRRSAVFSPCGGAATVREEERYVVPPATLLRIPGGRYYAEPSTVILPDDRMLAGPSQWFGSSPEDHWIFDKLWLRRARKLRGELFIFGHGYTNYYHFIIEGLPRVWLAKRAGLELRNFDWIYGDGSEARLAANLLDAMGIAQEKRVTKAQGLHFAPEKLTLIDITWWPGHWLLQAIREAFDDAGFVPDPAVQMPKRIYISRARAYARRLVNEVEALALLAPYGFVPIHLEKLGLGDQRALFSGAECIVAPHGAGLANLVFCGAQTKVLEIRHEAHRDHHWDMFRWLANLAGADYACITAEDPSGPERNHRDPSKRDMLVPLPGLQAAMAAFFPA